MNKCARIFAIFLFLVFILSGCVYKIDASKTNIYPELYNNIEKIKAIEEDDSFIEEKEKFLQLFKKWAGFSLPDYFVLPKGNYKDNGCYVQFEDSFMLVVTHFIVEKNDALKMLDFLKQDNNGWIGHLYKTELTSQYTKKERCTYFVRDINIGDTGSRPIYLNFHYDNKNNCYIVMLNAMLWTKYDLSQ